MKKQEIILFISYVDSLGVNLERIHHQYILMILNQDYHNAFLTVLQVKIHNLQEDVVKRLVYLMKKFMCLVDVKMRENSVTCGHLILIQTYGKK